MSANDFQFFWQKAGKQKSRFNLLLLEYGESFYEDLSVFSLPVPTASRTLQQCDSLKTQGRLKVCSRSLMFEPSDIKSPIVRYPYKNMTSPPSVYRVALQEHRSCMFESSGFVSFACSTVLEMKANGKVGPYRQVDDGAIPDAGRVLFALVHSEPKALLAKVDTLRQIFTVQSTEGKDAADRIKLPYNTTAISSGFDTSLLVDFHESLRLGAPLTVKKVSPMILNPGSIMLTDSRIYYQPANINNVDEIVQSIDLHKIHRIYCRRFLLQQIGIELLMSDGSSVLLCFETRTIRDHIYSLIIEYPRLSRNHVSLEDLLARWQRKEISNFEYLMHLNYEAGRSNNDLTQYPVFPHILRDFTSKSLDFKSPDTYRDLSLPIGALNPARLEHFQQRFHSMPQVTEKEIEEGMIPPFMYGTHYSTPGYALHYLVRVAPEHMLCLQAGKFDTADRMFTSIEETWASVTTNPADLKELIPEFFNGTGDFLVNKDDLDLGYKQSGERLGDVELPPWAKSPKDFIKKNVKALESSHVSNNIHHWIDLIFGYKQQGQAAVEANNVFYHLTYEGSVDWEKITSARERSALEIQIQEFGQTPRQLFMAPHPRRSDDPKASRSAVAVAPRLSPQKGSTTAASLTGTSGASGTAAAAATGTDTDAARNRRSSSPIPTTPALPMGGVGPAVRATTPPPPSSSSSSSATGPGPGSAGAGVPPRPPPRPLSARSDGDSDRDSEGAVQLLDDNFKSAVARELNGMHSGSSIPPALIVTPPKSLERRTLPAGSGSAPAFAAGSVPVHSAAAAGAGADRGGGVKKNLFGAAVSNIYSFFGGKDTPGAGKSGPPLHPPSASAPDPTTSSTTTASRPTSTTVQQSTSPVTVFYGGGNGGTGGSGSASRSASRDLQGAGPGDIFAQSREERASSSSNHSNPSSRRKRAGEVALPHSLSERSTSGDHTGGFYMNSFDHDSSNSMSELSLGAEPRIPSPPAGGSRQNSRGATGAPAPAATGAAGAAASGGPSSLNKSAPLLASRISLHCLPMSDGGSGHGGMPPNLHSGGITDISVREPAGRGSRQRGPLTVGCTTCSRDGCIKMLELCQEGRGSSVLLQTRRTFNEGSGFGGTSFNAVMLSENSKYLLAGAADGHLYSYSVPNAGVIAKTPLHDDSISVSAVDDSDRLLVTGAIDASIKIWRLKEGGSMILASPLPVSETFEHDNAITCLCISQTGTATSSDDHVGASGQQDGSNVPCYMAAGAEDGVLIVWDIRCISSAVLPLAGGVSTTKDASLAAFHQPTVMFSCQLGSMRRAVSAVRWVPHTAGAGHAGAGGKAGGGFDRDRFVCSTVDGHLVCMDAQGRLVMMTHTGVGILSLAVERRRDCVYIYGGCGDGSLRVWAMDGGAFVERYRVEHALRVRPPAGGIQRGLPDYDPPVPGKVAIISAMCVCSGADLLITGGDNGAFRLWNIDCSALNMH